MPDGEVRVPRRGHPGWNRRDRAAVPGAASRRGAAIRLHFRAVEAGCFAKRSAGRIGRRTNSPPQFGQRPASTPSAQAKQKVHS
jgi:hypothetical protein